LYGLTYEQYILYGFGFIINNYTGNRNNSGCTSLFENISNIVTVLSYNKNMYIFNISLQSNTQFY